MGTLKFSLVFCALTVLAHPCEQAVARDAKFTPKTLRYRGVHFGEHPLTTYELSERLTSASWRGKTIWQKTIERIHDGDDKPILIWHIEAGLDPSTGTSAFEKLSLPAMKFGYQFAVDEGVVRGSVTSGGITKTLPDLALSQGDPAIGGFESIDLALAALPLAEQFDKNFRLIEVDDAGSAFVTRAVRIHVTGAQTYQLKGKVLNALKVQIDPLDNNAQLTSTFLVSQSAPHLTLRHEMIAVFDKSAKKVRSTGTEALVDGIVG